jgi:diguanylate cyclase (GGDEF)-like protein
MKRSRKSDAIRAVDGLLDSYLQRSDLGGRPLANLAAAIAIEHSGADWGALLLDEGGSLVPALCLRHDLETAQSDFGQHMPGIIERAAASGELAAAQRELAAPVVLEGSVKGILYLEGFAPRASSQIGDLATAIASRIATLLSSAELVDELARRTENLEILESLSQCLSAGNLGVSLLDRALESAVGATRSGEGALGLLDETGALGELRIVGGDSPALQGIGGELAALASRAEPAERAGEILGDPYLFSPLMSDAVAPGQQAKGSRALGRLAVRRLAARSYDPRDSSFFLALAHLLAGALARREYFEKASQDPVTKTGSRLALNLNLAEAEIRSRKNGLPFSIILADVDNFKKINDRYGHPTGDAVLQQIGEILRGRLRSRDSVARYGGDEFVIILPDTGLAEAKKLAEELRQLVSREPFSELDGAISLSAGVASFAPASPDLEDLLRKADQALYRSKSGGRNRVTVSSPEPSGA